MLKEKAESPVQKIKSRVEEMLGDVDFAPKKTLVAQNVWYKEDEDLYKVVATIIHKVLNLPNISIVNTVRKSGWESGAGLIKIEVESAEQVKEVLKQKRLLKDNPVSEIRDIFLRQSKKEEVLLMERNQDVILREMGVRESYIRLSSGHL